jgi:hypothetical protein
MTQGRFDLVQQLEHRIRELQAQLALLAENQFLAAKTMQQMQTDAATVQAKLDSVTQSVQVLTTAVAPQTASP